MTDRPFRRRAARRGVAILTVAGGALLVLVVALLVGRALFDVAVAAAQSASERTSTARTALGEDVDPAVPLVREAALIGRGDPTLIGSGERDALSLQATAAAVVVGAGQALLVDGRAQTPFRSGPWWPMVGLVDEARRSAEDGRRTTLVRTTLAESSAALDRAAKSAFATAAASADTIEQHSRQARNVDTVRLRDAAESLASETAFTQGSASRFAEYTAAADAVRSSHASRLAAKAGPLLDARLAAEEFARSLAGGVLLQIDWAPVVNGYGGATGMGGLTMWAAADGGRATIELSDSVAANWPSPSARALVAHEVGHAISAKCWRMFDWDDQSANEQWATAWALSQGFDDPGNGEQLYGRPPDALVATAAGCR